MSCVRYDTSDGAGWEWDDCRIILVRLAYASQTSIMRAMLMRDVGEFQLIDMLAQTIAAENAACIERLVDKGFRVRLSIGDDAAAWNSPPGVRVLTTDTMVEGVHFNLNWISWRELGWKSLAVNLSDIAAMGCGPLYAVITLGLHDDLPVEGLKKMYRGVMDACQTYGGAILGGDIVKSPVFFVTIAMGGHAVVADKLLTRHSASPGDRIAATGHLGCSGGGLRLFTDGLVMVDDDTANHLRDAHIRPTPRISEGMVLAREGVTAALDISDGLVDDLAKMCKASGVGAVIHMDAVPADNFLKTAYPEDWLTLALGGGEDYELLFTAPPELMDAVAAQLEVPVSIIGDVVEGPPQVTVLDQKGNAVNVEHGGWDHFGLR